MASEIWTAVIGGLAGLTSGAVGSLIAPWANWSIEKRRLERQRRYDLLKSWRDGIAGMEGHDHSKYIASGWYETLRPYMWENTRRRLEAPRTVFVPADSGRGIRDLFTREVDRIEQAWGLRPRT
ncbi:hypothetical protein AWC19_27515 [Mycobacterium palustre]|uniref:Uncharacterized protein n=1 Tax=Mycobacterium palustre TaxID=153971 RepID=A0A1X1ZVL9_9MYCO|nr:hypothetical protein AWC19_27515 [Mycobacterium palustre]